MIAKICRAPNCSNYAVEGHCYCAEHLKESQEKHKAFENAKRSNEEFYHTSRWRMLRTEVVREQGCCQCCGTDTDLTVDHIIDPRGDEQLFFDKQNLQVLCKDCHRIKTAHEIAERKKKHN